VNTLLMAMCDSVIRLCSKFLITAGERTLEVLLLKQVGALAGTNFLDVLETSDRARFCEHMQDIQKTCGRGPAASLHVYARDSVGTRVSLQIFTTQFSDLDDHVCHLLGVRELSQEEYDVPMDGHLNRQIQDIQVHMPAHVQTNESLSGSSSDCNSTTSSSFLPLASPEANLDEVAIWFDPATMVILQTTPGFISIGGPSCECTDLRAWLVDPLHFENEVQSYYNMLVNQEEDEGTDIPTVHIPSLKLQPPSASRAQIEYRVDVMLRIDADYLPEPDSDFTMRATFTNVTQCRSRRKRRAAVHDRKSRSFKERCKLRI